MSARKISVRLGMATAAVSGLVLAGLAPAHADTKPANFTLGTTVIGVGSDTVQWVDDALSADFNATVPTPTPGWANFDACLGNTNANAPGLGDNPDGSGFPCGADHTGTKAGIKRDENVVDPALAPGVSLPSGSGDGRTLLRTPSDPLFNDVAYARSSGPINTTDLAAGEIALPFAIDKMVVVTHPGGPAPASLTGQQILKIYNGTYTNWNQVGGKNARIHPYMPKAGSGTLNVWLSLLAALDNVNEAPGSDNDPASHSAASQIWQGQAGAPTITDGNWNTGSPTAVPPTAANVEEHDPSAVNTDPKAIEPFSYGRAQLANGASQTVRIEGGWSEDRELYHVVRGQNIAGAATTPFVYGADGGLLESLFSNTGYVCSNATAQADIAGAGFWPLHTGTTTGSCGVKNANTQDTINPFASNGVNEGAATSTRAFFIGGSVHVTVSSNGTTPTGHVQLVVANPSTPTGSPAASFHTTMALGAHGTATVKLPATVSGNKTFDVAYLPTSFGTNGANGHQALGSSYVEFDARVPAAKVATTMKASVKPATLASSRANAKVTVIVKQASGTVKPTGTIRIMRGHKQVGSGTLKRGTVTITVKGTSLVKGKNTLVVKYVPTGRFTAPKTFPRVTIHRTK